MFSSSLPRLPLLYSITILLLLLTTPIPTLSSKDHDIYMDLSPDEYKNCTAFFFDHQQHDLMVETADGDKVSPCTLGVADGTGKNLLLGIILVIAGSISLNLGNNIMSLGHRENEELEAIRRLSLRPDTPPSLLSLLPSIDEVAKEDLNDSGADTELLPDNSESTRSPRTLMAAEVLHSLRSSRPPPRSSPLSLDPAQVYFRSPPDVRKGGSCSTSPQNSANGSIRKCKKSTGNLYIHTGVLEGTIEIAAEVGYLIGGLEHLFDKTSAASPSEGEKARRLNFICYLD
jgi:hypothetical protein